MADQPKIDFIKFLKVALAQDAVQSHLIAAGVVPLAPTDNGLHPHFDPGTFIAIAQLVCAAAAVACPIIDSLP